MRAQANRAQQDPKSTRPYRRKVGATGDKRHVLAGSGQSDAEITADGTGDHDRDPHDSVPRLPNNG